MAADPQVGETLTLADRPHRLAGVRLVDEIGLGDLEYTRTDAGWQLDLAVPEVDRLEYLLELRDHNDRRRTVCDPQNSLRAPGAFGEKSVLEFAGYVRPAWLDAPAAPATITTHGMHGIDFALWRPADLDDTEPAPLLMVHDGLEFASLGGFTDYLSAAIVAGALPPLRAALLDPGDRNVAYSASATYAASIEQLAPALLPTTARVGVGVSLGALAMLHLHRSIPDLFDGLFLQSGSFFTPDLDAQESGFSGFAAVTSFVASLHEATFDPAPVPVVITCGVVEENLANNEAMATTLNRLDYEVGMHRRRDAHNFVAWRDALDPYLAELITTAVAARAA